MLRLVTVASALALLVAACGSTVGPPATLESGPSDSSGVEIQTFEPLASPSPELPSSALTGTGHLPGEPDPNLTPGATNPAVTQDSVGSTICVPGWTATVRPPSSYTTSLKRQQIAAYGYGDTNLADYEEDHLIPLELGGAPADPANLWPEPYAVALADGTPVGARVKDQLENALRSSVCAGRLALATAQHGIATDWVRAWLALSGSGPAPAITAVPSSAVPPTPGSGAAGELSVAITSLTSPVSRGSPATLRASTSGGAWCSITVVYKSGPSGAAGLAAKTADGAGVVAWTWTVGSRTTTGSWPVTVSCSAGGSMASAGATLVVR
jgi:hypothetical protein